MAWAVVTVPLLAWPLVACADAASSGASGPGGGTPAAAAHATQSYGRAASRSTAAAPPATPPPAGASLCRATELTLFSCPAAQGKHIAICAAGAPGAADARAQYRFGRVGQVEMAYPADASAGPGALLASHYSRAGVDRLSIRFETPAAEYVVHDWAETGEPQRSGVDVSLKQPGAKDVHMACTGPVRVDPPAIAARLQCDRESALASCR